MGVVSYIADRLANVMSGRGTSIDRRTSNAWIMEFLAPDQVEAAYRTNWLVKKIVDVPAKDMTREWRNWQAKGSSIEDIEAEEKRLGLQAKCQRALILARLFGGGALILSTGDADTESELDPEKIGKDGLRFVHVMNRYELSLGQPIMDPESPWFRMPEYFQITTAGSQQNLKLHPSRVIPFIGQAPPEGGRFTQSDSWFWGDPIMLSINEAVQDAMTATAGFAALIDEAKLDIIKIPGLMTGVGTQEYEDRLMTRLGLANTGKSTHRALIIDGEEEWQQRQVNWAGIPAVIMQFLEVVAGAADIPVTRLLGQSPKGLQSTGKGEEKDYHAKVEGDQGELLKPHLERLDPLLLRSALGKVPDDVWWEFAPLDKPDESQDAEIEKKAADTIKVLADTGLFQDEALAELGRNRMIESGRWPGSEAAFEKFGEVPEDEPEADPDELKTAAELAAAKAEELRSKGTIDDAQAVALITDARPRTLYVSRKLVNAAEFLSWAKAQGFGETLEPDELHVTICYSRTPIDWLKVEAEDWNQEKDGSITIPAGGPRIVEPLGDKGAVVLLFGSSRLSWRHEQLIRAGASHDWDDYQPHITITYAMRDGFDLSKVEPFRGKLVFGPEIFQELDLDWTPKMKGVGEKAAAPFDLGDAFDPNQPRDLNGQWIDAGTRHFIQQSAQGQPGKQREAGKVGERAARRARTIGLDIAGKAVALDASGIRHIANRHGSDHRTQRPVGAREVASAALVLNRADRMRLIKPAATGAKRFIVSAEVRGTRIYAIFESRRRAVSLVSMWRKG
jgi:phage-related protein (TIGR01555 family)